MTRLVNRSQLQATNLIIWTNKTVRKGKKEYMMIDLDCGIGSTAREMENAYN
jgi:predicted 2-oxoglutarate/Fe(II)-dependent dioxygenase YbiX